MAPRKEKNAPSPTLDPPARYTRGAARRRLQQAGVQARAGSQAPVGSQVQPGPQAQSDPQVQPDPQSRSGLQPENTDQTAVATSNAKGKKPVKPKTIKPMKVEKRPKTKAAGDARPRGRGRKKNPEELTTKSKETSPKNITGREAKERPPKVVTGREAEETSGRDQEREDAVAAAVAQFRVEAEARIAHAEARAVEAEAREEQLQAERETRAQLQEREDTEAAERGTTAKEMSAQKEVKETAIAKAKKVKRFEQTVPGSVRVNDQRLRGQLENRGYGPQLTIIEEADGGSLIEIPNTVVISVLNHLWEDPNYFAGSSEYVREALEETWGIQMPKVPLPVTPKVSETSSKKPSSPGTSESDIALDQVTMEVLRTQRKLMRRQPLAMTVRQLKAVETIGRHHALYLLRKTKKYDDFFQGKGTNRQVRLDIAEKLAEKNIRRKIKAGQGKGWNKDRIRKEVVKNKKELLRHVSSPSSSSPSSGSSMPSSGSPLPSSSSSNPLGEDRRWKVGAAHRSRFGRQGETSIPDSIGRATMITNDAIRFTREAPKYEPEEVEFYNGKQLHHLPVGTRAARKEWPGRLLSGGQASIYKAREKRGSSDLVIKVFKIKSRSTLAKIKQVHKSLRREYDFLIQNQHRNIIKPYGIFADITVIKALMLERLDGDIHTLHISKSLSCRALYNMFRDMLYALEYVHKNGIIHHDVSWNNIMFKRDTTSNGKVIECFKLIDFGMAVHQGSRLTSSGNAPYLPPECFSLEDQYSTPPNTSTVSIDIWALFCVLMNAWEYNFLREGEKQENLEGLKGRRGYQSDSIPNLNPGNTVHAALVRRTAFRSAIIPLRPFSDMLSLASNARPSATEVLRRLRANPAYKFTKFGSFPSSLHLDYYDDQFFPFMQTPTAIPGDQDQD